MYKKRKKFASVLCSNFLQAERKSKHHEERIAMQEFNATSLTLISAAKGVWWFKRKGISF
jgi:hypothetical protein